MSQAATVSQPEARFQQRAKEHDVRTANIIAAKGDYLSTLGIDSLHVFPLWNA